MDTTTARMLDCNMFRDVDVVVPDNCFASQFIYHQAGVLQNSVLSSLNGNQGHERSISSRQMLKQHTNPPHGNHANTNCAPMMRLDNKDMWKSFDDIGTEMLVTRIGRRVFPALQVQCHDMLPDAMYTILVDVVPVDQHKYKYHDGEWVVAGSAEASLSNSVYVHPDSPAPGSVWMRKPVSFHKLKLTNNKRDKSGNIIVNTMQKYQFRIQVIKANDPRSKSSNNIQTTTFSETTFIVVTAYQSEEITKMKINNNPYARSFRDPSNASNRRNSRTERKSSTDEVSAGEDPHQEKDCSTDSKRRRVSSGLAHSQDDGIPLCDDVFSFNPPVTSSLLYSQVYLQGMSEGVNSRTVASQRMRPTTVCQDSHQTFYHIAQTCYSEPSTDQHTRKLQAVGQQNASSHSTLHVNENQRITADLSLDLNRNMSLSTPSERLSPVYYFGQETVPSQCQRGHLENCQGSCDNELVSHLYTPKVERICHLEKAHISPGNPISFCSDALDTDFSSWLSTKSLLLDQVDWLSETLFEDEPTGQITTISADDVDAVLTSIATKQNPTSAIVSHQILNSINVTRDVSGKVCLDEEQKETNQAFPSPRQHDILSEAFNVAFCSD